MKRLTFFIIIAILISGCVRSKSKERGGSEVEIAVPPRVTSRTRPELKQAQPYTSPEPFFSHSLDWTLYEKKLEKTKAKVGRKFTVEGFGPFLVVSNLPEKQLQRIKENALRISYNALYRDFFDKRLHRLVTIYIFKDQQDYLQYSRKLFNESPTTPYGYYRSDDSVVVVNGATGNGTLVHEMVHALIDSDFPQMPTWFNEGLAALFEESRVEVGKIVGMNNWRYPIFKQAIAAKSFVNLEELMKKSNEEFYDDRDGFNYAESRYFCYYLQQRGLLIPFYKRFRENIEKDPHGIETLKEVLGKELEEVEADWLEWATVSVYQKR